MARTSEQGLLNKIGFRDEQRGTALHTDACLFLADHDNMMILANHLIGVSARHRRAREGISVAVGDEFPMEFSTDNIGTPDKVKVARLECPIVRRGGYFIGLIDVFAHIERFCFDVKTTVSGKKRVTETWWEPLLSLCVEVKSKPVDIAALMAQMGVYLEYTQTMYPTWVVATCYTMPRHHVEQLHSIGVHHVMLGERFAAWREAQSDMPAAASFSL